MSNERKPLIHKLRLAIKNLDNILGCYYEAQALIVELTNDSRLTDEDRKKLLIANKVISGFDPHSITPAIKFLSSTEKAKDMSNNPVPNEPEENRIVELFMLYRASLEDGEICDFSSLDVCTQLEIKRLNSFL